MSVDGMGLLIFIALGLWVAVQSALMVYVVPDRSVAAMAKIANVPRRHLESLVSWTRRIEAVTDARSKANDAFLAAAQTSGTAEYHGRAITYRLPRNHRRA